MQILTLVHFLVSNGCFILHLQFQNPKTLTETSNRNYIPLGFPQNRCDFFHIPGVGCRQAKNLYKKRTGFLLPLTEGCNLPN